MKIMHLFIEILLIKYYYIFECFYSNSANKPEPILKINHQFFSFTYVLVAGIKK